MELIGGILHDENTITGLPLLSSPARKYITHSGQELAFLFTTSDNHKILWLKTCPQVTCKNTVQ